MVQMNFGPYLETEIKQKQEKVSQDYRQFTVGEPTDTLSSFSDNAAANVLVEIGKKLVSFGTLLEHRYSQNLVETQSLKTTNCEGSS